MIYSAREILDRIELGEDSRWEFKQVEFAGTKLKSPKCAVLADEIAAFANSRGGVVLCGVTDDGRVQSLTRGQLAALDNVLAEVGTDSIKPPVPIQTHHMRLPDGGGCAGGGRAQRGCAPSWPRRELDSRRRHQAQDVYR